MGTPESAVKTRPKTVVGGVAAIAVGSLSLLVVLSTVRSSLAGCFGGAFLALGIVSLARTNRFRWWQIALIVLATFVAAALVLGLALVGLVLFAFRHYP
jgi:hypothetical protein